MKYMGHCLGGRYLPEIQRHLVTTEGDTTESSPRERAWILDDITH